ncbi:peptidoglycan-binding domain-containing protein [Yinghuangia seranimata]|uniref:peptidoglycan-binding domain-containing protein n=1 Tax=Yinghuangia seranimata TaxID=408067 RepID=UPI00248C6CE2|nr:peptidoglycan-binding domain-containing protein [Yinghuangia seranimata]MDI2124946.1 peptidoglycan-binding domain-containing protein [Yinghuangia seranimata]
MNVRKRMAAVGVAATLLAGAGVAFTATEASATTYTCHYTRTTNPYRTYAGYYSGSTYVPHFGESSKPVIEAQCLLRGVGYNITADGIYGQKTKDAMTNFQANHALWPDGYVGPDSWPVLRYFG